MFSVIVVPAMVMGCWLCCEGVGPRLASGSSKDVRALVWRDESGSVMGGAASVVRARVVRACVAGGAARVVRAWVVLVSACPVEVVGRWSCCAGGGSVGGTMVGVRAKAGRSRVLGGVVGDARAKVVLSPLAARSKSRSLATSLVCGIVPSEKVAQRASRLRLAAAA